MLRKSLSHIHLYIAALFVLAPSACQASTYSAAYCNGTTSPDGKSYFNAHANGLAATYTDSGGKITGYYSSGTLLVVGAVNGVTVYYQARIRTVQIVNKVRGIIKGDFTYNGKAATLRVEFNKPDPTNPKGRVGWCILGKDGDWAIYPTGKNSDGSPKLIQLLVNTGITLSGPFTF